MAYYVNLPNGEKMLFEDNVPHDQARYQAMVSYYTPKEAPVATPAQPVSRGGLGSDVLGSVIRGAGTIPELGGNIYGLATGDFDNIAVRAGKAVQEYGESFYSPEMKAAQERVQQAQQAAEGQGFLTEAGATAGAYLSPQNWRALLGTAAEQIPLLATTMGGGVATRAGAAGIRGLTGRQLTKEAAEAAGARAGTIGAVGTGAALQGADVAGDTYKEVMDLDQKILNNSPAYRGLIETGMKPEDAKRTLALSAAREAGLFSGLESAATGAMIPGVERLPFTKGSQAGLIRRVLTGASQEGLQEALEEGGGAAFKNLAVSRIDEQRDLMRGVGTAAAAGAIPGALLGGAGHALHRAPAEPAKGELPEIQRAIEESRSATQVTTPIGDISWNDAYDLYSKRYGDISKLVPDEYERIAVGNILLAQELKPIQGKIESLRADLETAPNDAAEKKIQGQIDALEGNLPSLSKPMRGARTGSKAFTEGEINAALAQVRGAKSIYGQAIGPDDLQGIKGIYSEAIGPTNFERIYGQPAGPIERLRLPAPEPIPTPTKFFWRSDDLGGFDIPIDLSGVAYTAKDGRRFFRATVLNSNQEMSIPADQVHAESGTHETTEPRTILPEAYKAPAGPDVSTAAERPTSFRAAFPENEVVSERTIPPEDVYRRMGGYKRPQESPKTTTEAKNQQAESGEGGAWRPTTPDEIHPPGRKFRMNTTTGQSEVFEPNVSQREEVKTPTSEEPVTSKPKTSKSTTSATTGSEFTKTSGGKRLLDKIDAAVAANDETALHAAQQEYQAALKKYQTKGEPAPTEEARPYTEAPRETGWTGEGQFALAPESTQATPEAATETPKAPPPPITLKANKVIDDFLSGLEKRGKLGKQSAEELRRVMADRKLNNNQVYAAFLAANQVNDLLPQTADHRLEFIDKLYGKNPKRLIESGASNVNAVGTLESKGLEAQGARIAPKKLENGTIEQGIIRISLAEDMLSAIHETAAHEAYHVLQDYYAKYDSNFNRMLDTQFVAKHDLLDTSKNPILDNNGKPIKGMYISEIDKTIIDKLSSTKAKNGKTYWENLSGSVKNLISKEEAQAYSFAALHDANMRGMPISSLKPSYKRFVNFLRNFLTKMKNALSGAGYKNFADMFGETRAASFEGKAAPVNARENVQYSARNVGQTEPQIINEDSFSKSAQDASDNIQYAVRGDTVTEIDLVDSGLINGNRKYNFAADLKHGGYLHIEISIASDDESGIKSINIDTIDAIQIKNNPFKFNASGYGKYSEGVRLGYVELKRLFGKIIPYIKNENPDVTHITATRVTGSRMRAERDIADRAGLSINEEKLKTTLPAIQYSARDVSQYALRPPASAGATVLERVTGEHYNKPSIFDRALGKIFGAKEGESFKSAAWRTLVNRTYPVYVLEDLMRSQGKWTGRAVAKAMEMSLNNTGRIQTLLDHGLIRYNKNTGDVEFVNNSKALRDIFGGKIPDSMKKEFQLYAVALRERDLRKNGKQGFFNISNQEVDDVIKKYEASNPEWKTVAADLQKFNEGLIQFALDTGTIDQRTANKLNSMFYTPYYRQMQNDVDGAPEQVLGPSLTRSLNNAKPFPHPLKGGSEAVGDLYENIIRNADSIIRAGMKNVAMKDASKLLEIANLATRTTHAGTRDEKVITFRDNGKPVHFKIDDPILWSAIGGLPAQSRHGILKAMDRVARFFRDAVTLSPRFMLANLWRGKIVAYAQEGQPFFSNTLSGLADGLKGGEASRNIAAITGFGGYSYGMGERDVAKNFSRKMRIAGGEASMFDRVMQGINAVQHFSEATELAERVNIYNRLLAEGKTEGEAAWAAYQFAPFSRSGSGEAGLGAILQSLMPMIPFLNAKIQGLARVIEGQPGDKRVLGLPKQLMLRGMLVTAFSIAAAALARSSDPDAWDKETIQNIMNYDILGYVNGNPITLPRGFEVGTLFGAIPVFIVRKFTQEHGEDMGKVLREAILNTFGFDPLPPAVKPIIEIAANRNFFRGMPLENLAQQRLPAGERVSQTTSGTAKLLSGAVNASGIPGLFDAKLSPIQAQHLIEGYLGTVGASLVAIADNIAGAAGAMPSKPTGAFGDPYSPGAIAAQISGLDVFYRSGATRPDRFVSDFYKLERDVNEIYNSVRDAQKRGDTQVINRMLEEHRMPLQMHKALNQAHEQMTKINHRIDFVRMTDTMNSNAKAEEINRLNKIKGNLARQMILNADRLGISQ